MIALMQISRRCWGLSRCSEVPVKYCEPREPARGRTSRFCGFSGPFLPLIAAATWPRKSGAVGPSATDGGDTDGLVQMAVSEALSLAVGRAEAIRVPDGERRTRHAGRAGRVPDGCHGGHQITVDSRQRVPLGCVRPRVAPGHAREAVPPGQRFAVRPASLCTGRYGPRVGTFGAETHSSSRIRSRRSWPGCANAFRASSARGRVLRLTSWYAP